MTRADAIVVGSGVSGLTSACLLAASGRRVIVLEQHYIPGGLLQRFRRGGVPFDTGFHYIGGAAEGGPLRCYLEFLGILDRLTLEPFDPDGFDEIVLPGRRFAFPTGRAAIRTALHAAFPAERVAIDGYFDLIERLTSNHPLVSFVHDEYERPAQPREAERSVSEVLTSLTADDDLRAVLSAQCMLYGVPADRASIDAHAMVCDSFYHSVHGLDGGGDALISALVERLGELGGELRLRHDVERITAADGAVTGVRTASGEVFEAPEVVATAHPSVVLELLGDTAVPRRYRRRVEGLRNAPSALLVHGVARGVATPHGRRRNWWWFPSPEDAWKERRPWFERSEPPPGVVVLAAGAVPELPGSSVFQVACLLREGELDGSGSRAEWRRRKLEAGRRLLDVVAECEPRWRGHLEVLDVSTPYALSHFVRSPEGSCYGVECSTDQWVRNAPPVRLGVRGLVLAGQSVGLPGVLGCMVTAFLAAGSLRGDLASIYSELRRVFRAC